MSISELDLENQHSTAAQVAEISDADLDTEIVVADPTRDINIPLEPPPAGIYPIVWSLNPNKKDGGAYFKQADKSGQWLLMLAILGKVQTDNEDYKDFVVADFLNSYLRKGTTAIHHFMNCIGQPLQGTTSLNALREHCREVLGTEPTGYAFLEWKASVQRGGIWKDIANRMTDFPKITDEKGNVSYQPWLEVENEQGEMVKVYAQAKIVAHVLPPQQS